MYSFRRANKIDVYFTYYNELEQFRHTGRTYILRDLVNESKNYPKKNADGKTLLHNVIQYYSDIDTITKLIEYLINCNINIMVGNKYGYTILHVAAQQEYNITIIKLIIEHIPLDMVSTFINTQNHIKCTALHDATDLYDNLEVIKFLIEQGANIKLRDNDNNTILHNASTVNKNYETIKYIIECIDKQSRLTYINLKNKEGFTALHKACMVKQNIDVIRLLIEYDANISYKVIDGLTALDIAYYYDNIKYMPYLINFNSKININLIIKDKIYSYLY